MSAESGTENEEQQAAAVRSSGNAENEPEYDSSRRIWGGVADGGLLVFLAGLVVGLTFLLALIPYVGWACILPAQLFLPVCVALWALLRDLNGGRFAPGKRVSHSVIVDVRTGEVASNMQCIGRNSYYALIALFACWTCACSFMVGMPLLWLVSVVDGILLATSERNQRFGDFLAGTRVVPK